MLLPQIEPVPAEMHDQPVRVAQDPNRALTHPAVASVRTRRQVDAHPAGTTRVDEHDARRPVPVRIPQQQEGALRARPGVDRQPPAARLRNQAHAVRMPRDMRAGAARGLRRLRAVRRLRPPLSWLRLRVLDRARFRGRGRIRVLRRRRLGRRRRRLVPRARGGSRDDERRRPAEQDAARSSHNRPL